MDESLNSCNNIKADNEDEAYDEPSHNTTTADCIKRSDQGQQAK